MVNKEQALLVSLLDEPTSKLSRELINKGFKLVQGATSESTTSPYAIFTLDFPADNGSAYKGCRVILTDIGWHTIYKFTEDTYMDREVVYSGMIQDSVFLGLLLKNLNIA